MIAARLLLGFIGVGLLAAGAVYSTLGLWGVDRRGAGAWMLTLIGVLAIGVGTVLLTGAIKPRRRSDQG
jgi:hypothetical protein